MATLMYEEEVMWNTGNGKTCEVEHWMVVSGQQPSENETSDTSFAWSFFAAALFIITIFVCIGLLYEYVYSAKETVSSIAVPPIPEGTAQHPVFFYGKYNAFLVIPT
jgi:hypothetical protein